MPGTVSFEAAGRHRWLIRPGMPGTPRGMLTEGLIYASAAMLEDIRADRAHEQVANVACLPGIVGRSLAMPDIHWGYGFPIGGVAATDPAAGGVVSPGGVGYDINCGVRLLRTTLDLEKQVRPNLQRLLERLYRDVPPGVGGSGGLVLEERELTRVLEEGARWAVARGYGRPEDLICCEDGGCLESAGSAQVGAKARKRGLDQLGTLGSGNHFLEVGVVDEIYDAACAAAFGLRQGMVTIAIHVGSRGLGHQVCADQLELMAQRRGATASNCPTGSWRARPSSLRRAARTCRPWPARPTTRGPTGKSSPTASGQPSPRRWARLRRVSI